MAHKKNVSVECPDISKEYYGSIGEVDLCVLLIELYRAWIIPKKNVLPFWNFISQIAMTLIEKDKDKKPVEADEQNGVYHQHRP